MERNQLQTYFSYYTAFEAQDVLQRKLENDYRRRGACKKNALEWSYRNTPTFHYEWMIGRTYWEEALHSSLITKPLLLFYGLAHLLKGLVLIKDPYYPASADVLAHGITSRKRKKKGYRFLDDEVKIQKNGFFPYFSSSLFHMKHPYGEKWKMKQLFFKWETFIHLYLQIHGTNSLPIVSLSPLQITIQHIPALKEERLLEVKKQIEALSVPIKEVKTRTADTVVFSVEHIPENINDFFIKKGASYYLPPVPSRLSQLSTISTHYLILYNLSMLCRYEGEWWGDILTQRQTEDYSFIYYYLNLAPVDIPELLEGFFNPGESLQ